jgi:hypothetical protein
MHVRVTTRALNLHVSTATSLTTSDAYSTGWSRYISHCKATARASPEIVRDTDLKVYLKETNNEKVASFLRAAPNVEEDELRAL